MSAGGVHNVGVVVVAVAGVVVVVIDSVADGVVSTVTITGDRS